MRVRLVPDLWRCVRVPKIHGAYFRGLSFDLLFNWESSENMFSSVAFVICIIYRSDSPYKAVENER